MPRMRVSLTSREMPATMHVRPCAVSSLPCRCVNHSASIPISDLRSGGLKPLMSSSSASSASTQNSAESSVRYEGMPQDALTTDRKWLPRR